MMNTNTTPDIAGIATIPFTIKSQEGNVLFCDARFPEGTSGPFPVIIFTHGFKGFKDWGPFPYVCSRLAKEGYYVISFNFSHNGVRGHSTEFTELKKFAANTFTREVQELGAVVDAVSDGEIPNEERACSEDIALIGHSRGGGIALLEAADDGRIKALVTWSSVSTFARYTESQKERWKVDGYLEAKNMRTGQMMRQNVTLLEDLENHARALNITAATARFNRPLLILHGEQDLTVRNSAATELANKANPDVTELSIIPRTAHTFGTAHPFQGTTEALEEVLATTLRFFATYLNQHR